MTSGHTEKVWIATERTAPHGTVLTHASMISPTFRQFAWPVEAPIPSSEPTLTCVVLTGML